MHPPARSATLGHPTDECDPEAIDDEHGHDRPLVRPGVRGRAKNQGQAMARVCRPVDELREFGPSRALGELTSAFKASIRSLITSIEGADLDRQGIPNISERRRSRRHDTVIADQRPGRDQLSP